MYIQTQEQSQEKLNVEYLKNGVFENKLKDKKPESDYKDFTFKRMFTNSNAIKDIQNSSNYKKALHILNSNV